MKKILIAIFLLSSNLTFAEANFESVLERFQESSTLQANSFNGIFSGTNFRSDGSIAGAAIGCKLSKGKTEYHFLGKNYGTMDFWACSIKEDVEINNLEDAEKEITHDIATNKMQTFDYRSISSSFKRDLCFDSTTQTICYRKDLESGDIIYAGFTGSTIQNVGILK